MECSVCYDECKRSKKLICGHTFCTGCIKKWFMDTEEPKCPMCRGPVVFKGFFASGWRKEKEYNNPDKFFGEVVDALLYMYILDSSCMQYIITMHLISRIQTTINVMYQIGYDYEDIGEAITASNWFSPRIKWVSFYEPTKNMATRYPKIRKF